MNDNEEEGEEPARTVSQDVDKVSGGGRRGRGGRLFLFLREREAKKAGLVQGLLSPFLLPRRCCLRWPRPVRVGQ